MTLLLLILKRKMTSPKEDPYSSSNKRWYDHDPALRRALEQLRNAPDHYQAQIALNIIKIIVEHQMEQDTEVPAEELKQFLSRENASGHTNDRQRNHRRWYDVHETLHSAIQLLPDTPPDLQKRMIPSIAQMIEQTLTGTQE